MKKELENKIFEQNFKQCCWLTCGHLTEVSEENQKEYDELHTKYKLLCDAMKVKLGEDTKLLLEYDDVKNALSGMEDETIYHQGFRDCVYLLRWIGML